jgi:SAM-dependent methyltransferase
MQRYEYHPAKGNNDFGDCVKELIARSCRVTTKLPGGNGNVWEEFAKYNLVFKSYEIDHGRLCEYLSRAGYTERYPDYYPSTLREKTLEHFVGIDLLNLTHGDVFIDIASECSPLSEICTRLYGVESFGQDIMYQYDPDRHMIGGDACAMPVCDGFATKAILTCAFEHFEGDGDVRLFHELKRVLRPGGIVCIIPFYVHANSFIITDPTVSAPTNVRFDEGELVYCSETWQNRFGRHYSPRTFTERILTKVGDCFNFEFYHLVNFKDVGSDIYSQFAFTATVL